MVEFKCPICGKVGLEDYLNKEIICPACNSDLGVFKLLNQKIPNRKGYRYLAVVGLFCAVALIFMMFSSNKSQIEFKAKINENEKTIVSLKDSINNIKKAQSPIITTKEEKYYTVKKGDSFCLISFKLFGTEIYALEIAELNNLDINSIIQPDQQFKIPKK